MQADRYTYRVTWSAEAREHAGLCAEFPSLCCHAPTPDEALTAIRRVVRDAVRDMQTRGEPVPMPLAWSHESPSSQS
jgi:predicted RNase H-like HicB family nuclease